MGSDQSGPPIDDLYVCDLDGTLLRPDATLSPASLQGLNRLLDAGVQFTVATARSLPAVRRLLAGVRLRLPLIQLNGAFITDPVDGRHLEHRLLDPDTADAALRILATLDLDAVLTSWDGTADHVGFGPRSNPGTAWYIAEKQAMGDPRLRPHPGAPDVAPGERIATVTTFAPDGQAAALAARVTAALGDTALVTHAPNHYVPGWSELQIVHPQAEKGTAVRRLRELLGRPAGRLTVLGDHLNDLPMFAVADRSVAPANAHPQALQQADLVVGGNNDDGVVRFLLAEHSAGGAAPC
ncbi:HAD-IIB family hydrolase [Kitasatospora sp. HPMI-4]|uniref:HAD-IIB family hydrolase n=1 Tax=Kitasatospora sp. HPMI-4 TaxID=3448443 RepID=UPI003F1B2703